MTGYLSDIRDGLGFTQAQMAGRLGMSLRGYQVLEAEPEKVRRIHELAAERVALEIATDLGVPMMAPPVVRRQALELARLLVGRQG